MSKTLWHTITIKVPSEMIELTKSGKISIKKTLTKTMNISKSQKQPSIKLVPSKSNKPEIINDGKEWEIEHFQGKLNKAYELSQKNTDKDIFTINTHSKLKNFKKNVKEHAQQLIHDNNENKIVIENGNKKKIKIKVKEPSLSSLLPTNLDKIEEDIKVNENKNKKKIKIKVK